MTPEEKNMVNSGHKIRRADSWIHRAEEEARPRPDHSPDHSIIAVCYWIAFNAMYANKKKSEKRDPITRKLLYNESKVFREFIWDAINAKLGEELLREALTNDESRAAIRKIFEEEPIRRNANGDRDLQGMSIYRFFWRGDTERSIAKTRPKFSQENMRMRDLLDSGLESKENLYEFLRILFGRIYELRKQLMHGSATGSSGKHRWQSIRGAEVMGHIVPPFLTIIKENRTMDWGEIYYPMISQKEWDKI